jgi:5-methylcytosine-specific restriction protein A
VIDNFTNIDSNRISSSVRDFLKDENLTYNHDGFYLYGIAREYLNRKGLNPPMNPLSASDIQSEFEKAVEEAKNFTPAERKARSKKDYPKKPEQVDVAPSKTYLRNPYVVVDVLERADGKCERCDSKAPFIRAKNNTPYLEVHHIVQLAHDGDDTVKNAIALCPNCHRELHFGVVTQNYS